MKQHNLLKPITFILLLIILLLHTTNQNLIAQETINPQNNTPNPTSDTSTHAIEKQISIQQPPSIIKKNKVELGLALSLAPSDTYTLYMPISARIAYHFNEIIAAEFNASFMGCFSSKQGPQQRRAAQEHCLRFISSIHHDLINTHQNITNIRNITLKQRHVARFNLSPVWAPFNLKLSLHNTFLSHLELNLSLPIGILITESFDKMKPTKLNHNLHFEFAATTGLKFFFLQYLGIRADFKQHFFIKKYKKQLGTSSEFSLGITFLL